MRCNELRGGEQILSRFTALKKMDISLVPHEVRRKKNRMEDICGHFLYALQTLGFSRQKRGRYWGKSFGTSGNFVRMRGYRVRTKNFVMPRIWIFSRSWCIRSMTKTLFWSWSEPEVTANYCLRLSSTNRPWPLAWGGF